jgi:HEAT repeat protein
VVAAEPKRIEELLRALDSDQFAVREKAGGELAKLGEATIPALRKALESGPQPDARKQVQALLDALAGWSPERLRGLRAVEALEHAGTPEAQTLLRELAAGAPGARLTDEAQAALGRLKQNELP